MQPFPQGMSRDQPLQIGDHLRVPTQVNVSV